MTIKCTHFVLLLFHRLDLRKLGRRLSMKMDNVGYKDYDKLLYIAKCAYKKPLTYCKILRNNQFFNDSHHSSKNHGLERIIIPRNADCEEITFSPITQRPQNNVM